jgi:hypothetical protein
MIIKKWIDEVVCIRYFNLLLLELHSLQVVIVWRIYGVALSGSKQTGVLQSGLQNKSDEAGNSTIAQSNHPMLINILPWWFVLQPAWSTPFASAK